MSTVTDNRILQWLTAVWERLYRYHYGVGIHTTRLCRRIGRRTERLTRPARRFLRYVWLRRAVLPVHRFLRRQRQLGARMKPAFHQLGEAAKKNVFAIFPCFGHLCRSAVKNYWDELTALGRFVGPVAAVALLLVTLSGWTGVEYCLTVTYRDEVLGAVESATVYDRGAALARGRVINADDSFEVDAVPTFTMTVRGSQPMLSDTEVCDAILRQSSDAIVQVSGLYVDGAFVGAMEDEEDLQAVLAQVKEGRYDKDDPLQRAEFVQGVEIVEGLYPITAVVEGEVLLDTLTRQVEPQRTHVVVQGDTLSAVARQYDVTTAELRRLNPQYAESNTLTVGEELLIRRARPLLQVKVVKTAVVVETIDYKTKTVYRDDKPVTYNKVTTKGKEGAKDVTYEHVYLDGEEIEVTRIGEEITKQPVTKVVEIGTKKAYTSGGAEVVQGDGVYTGDWTWPVPVCHRVYQGYHSGHLAWDISSGPTPVLRTPCLAVDGGTVVYAGRYYGYGNYVKIDHGNGIQTTYAHLDSIAVVVGQKVSNGQQIGKVGNTGNSKGPHLHFEVIRNGVRVNPKNYFDKSDWY
ncbi:MAG: M23 family metallopeptidase [Clostridia bacterium]|nr:M23 family metallopeptidase [Clostridia bacterium]